jgi:hypothetical protein
MISEKRICKSCGHRCHCYQPDCDECVNDVCTKCDCKNEIDYQERSEARSWDNYLK